VIDLIGGVALAGIGTGLSVLVAQAPREPQQRQLLRAALRTGLSVSLSAMGVVGAFVILDSRAAALTGLAPARLALAAVAGCVAVAPGMLNSYWLGQQRRGAMLALALGSAAISLAAALAAPRSWVLEALVCGQAVPAALLAFVPRHRRVADDAETGTRRSASRLLRYVPPSIAIGVLSPAAMLGARSVVSSALSWHAAGELQALWRVSDWVCALAGGVLSVYFLPQLSAAVGTPRFSAELARAARAVAVPSAAAFAVLLALQRPVFALLYDPSVRLAYGTVAVFFAGSLARIGAWIPLFALYATRRTLAITAGEFLSLPLFTVLLAAFAHGLTLERAGELWLASYLVYGAFNLWALSARPRLTAT
jgi:O-antigen/teichoic acid export membrane protein